MSEFTLTISLLGLKPPHCSEADIDNCKKPNISMIGTDQLDDFDLKEKAHKLSLINWWMFSIFFGTLFANTVLVYIQDNVGWTLGYILLALGFALSIAIFLSRTPYYWHRAAAGSPFTRMARVMVAVVRKWRVRVLSDPKELYELDPQEYAKKGN